MCLVAQLCLTLCDSSTIAHKAPLSIEFSRQETWKPTGVGCHFLLQGIFLTQGPNPVSLASPAVPGGFFTTVPPGKLMVGGWMEGNPEE